MKWIRLLALTLSAISAGLCSGPCSFGLRERVSWLKSVSCGRIPSTSKLTVPCEGGTRADTLVHKIWPVEWLFCAGWIVVFFQSESW